MSTFSASRPRLNQYLAALGTGLAFNAFVVGGTALVVRGSAAIGDDLRQFATGSETITLSKDQFELITRKAVCFNPATNKFRPATALKCE
jgi:hypothetical protein